MSDPTPKPRFQKVEKFDPIKREAMSEKTIEEHLLARGLLDAELLAIEVVAGKTAEDAGVNEITQNDELLEKVADAWKTHGLGIRAVVAQRIKKLLLTAALHDIPQEVTVSRQCIVELIGLLDDFEKSLQEQVKRNQKNPPKEGDAPASPAVDPQS